MAVRKRPVPTCPDTCPLCGVDLKSEGYPLGHRTDEGDECSYEWAPGSPFDYEED
jgi:hypothetical protein